MKLSGELDYRIRYDVEHDLFHAQNVFNDEYIKPTFIEYVQKLEKDNRLLEQRGSDILKELLDKNKKCIELKQQIEKMKCCNNCKFDNLEPPEVISNGVCENCINHSKWELED